MLPMEAAAIRRRSKRIRWSRVLVLATALTCSLVTDRLEARPALEPQADHRVPILTPDGTTILAELADTTEKRARGLMYRESLPKHHGMLFTFPEPQPWTFWMKNTRMPLDIIWIDDQKRIVHIERNVPICTRNDDGCPNYQPNRDALYVLELAGGEADSLHLERGTRLRFDAPPDPSVIQRRSRH